MTHSEGERILYLDALRTIASLAVVTLHVSASNTYYVDFHSHAWNIFMQFEAVVNWAVPMFTMISGAVMLPKEWNYQKVFAKCKRLILIFFIWSAFYLVFDLLNNGIETYQNAIWLQVLFQGHYHMWYLLMLFGLYLIIPLLKAITAKRQNLVSFVCFSALFTFFVPSVVGLTYVRGVRNIFQLPVIGALYRALQNVVEDVNFFLTLGFAAYFVIGYALVNYVQLPRKKCAVYGITSMAFGTVIMILELYFSVSKDAIGILLKYNQVGILLQACGLLLFAKANPEGKTIYFLAKISPVTLGIYLIHPIFIEILQHAGVTSLSFNPWFSIPILSICIFIAAGIVTRIIMSTPARVIVSTGGGKKDA